MDTERRARREDRYPFLPACAALLAGFLLVGKVHSPQYALWLIPLFALVRIRFVWYALFVAGNVVMYLAIFGASAWSIHARDVVVTWSVWARTATLLCIVLAFLRAPAPVPLAVPGRGIRPEAHSAPIDGVCAGHLPFLRLADRSRAASQIPTRDAVSPACRRRPTAMSDIETTTEETPETAETVGSTAEAAETAAPAERATPEQDEPTAVEAEATAPEQPPRRPEATPVVATPEPAGEDYTPEELVQAMEASLRDFKDGDIMEGVVVKIDRDEILLDIGYKSEGVIPSKELSIRHDVDPNEVVKVGDRIEALVLQKEDKEGRLILSKKRAQYERAWGRIEETMAAGNTIKGPVIEVVKGGLILDIGLRGFLPASLVDLRRVRDLQPYIGTELEAKIIELDRNRNNVVLSRRAFLEESQSEGRKKFLENLQKSERRKGTVSSIVNFGAFVDLGGVDGLVHVSELSWKHVDHPSEVVTVGQEVEVEVLDVDLERERVSLSLKATQEDPWKEFERKYKAGEVIPGQVTKLVPFGAFVRVSQGIEGLVHISELSHEHIDTPESVLSVGDEVQVKVVDVDVSRRRVSLSMRQVTPAPAKPDGDRGGARGRARTGRGAGDDGPGPASGPGCRRGGRRDAGQRPRRSGDGAAAEEPAPSTEEPRARRRRAGTGGGGDVGARGSGARGTGRGSPRRRRRRRRPPTRKSPWRRSSRTSSAERAGPSRAAAVLLVGLTGGIGSGKSTVARLLERRGAAVIDADQLAREAVAKGTPGFERVVEAFGPDVVTPEGDLDRPALAARIFSDPVQKAALEAIVHPEVARRFGDQVDTFRDTDRIVVYVTPLLVELGLAPAFDVVVVVTASPHLRVSRVASDRGLSPDEVRGRLAVQATDEQRAEVAGVLIDNDGSLADLEPQVDRLWNDLMARAGA